MEPWVKNSSAKEAGGKCERSLSGRYFYSFLLILSFVAGIIAADAAPASIGQPTVKKTSSKTIYPRKKSTGLKKSTGVKSKGLRKKTAVGKRLLGPSPTKTTTAGEPKPMEPAETVAPKPASPSLVRSGVRETARIESFRNKVEIRAGNEDSWKKAASSKILKTDDAVRTGRQSIARVKLADGSKILLLQNSQAELEDLSSVQKAIKLIRGKIRAVVTKMKGEASFKIKTPIGVASVRGTDFEVEFSEESQEMFVDVRKGAVGVARLGDLENEVVVRPGERIQFGLEGAISDPIRMGAVPLDRQEVRGEVIVTQEKNRVVAMAAEESRNADYQVGKSMLDVDGRRVRIEEYIMRPNPNQFKLVVLNERASRFDYFYYMGTFNTTLPSDLSIALGMMNGKLGVPAPDYYLTASEMYMSNTRDSIKDVQSGGHLVKIEFDGTNYTLTDNLDATNTRTIPAAEVLAGGGYKIYNPLKDAFSLVSAANLTEALKIAVNDNGTYRNLVSGDTYWKTRFNNYGYYINGVQKTLYAAKSGVTRTLSIDADVDWTNPAIATISETPSGTSSLYNRLTLYYAPPDGKKTVFDNYIIDDEGNVAPASAFAGITTSAAYQNELVKWNYQQKVKADEMSDSINLVIDPRIGVMSGLMQ